MSLFQITITGSKTFYVEAENEEQALGNSVVADEMTGFNEFEWEVEGGEARKMSDTGEKCVRERDSELIVSCQQCK